MSSLTTPQRGEPNRLSREKSPYLLQHQWNPVDWYSFGEEAIARARREDKPIFLSIGYSTCHWCHVMERESFENDAIARLMNERYVNVKVDREERPDLDQIYMQAAIAMHGQGGWPLSVWLLPDLRPYYCGTYFPPTARYGRPGFADVLRSLADLFRDRRADAEEQGAACVRWLERERAAESPSDTALDALPETACRVFLRSFDEEFGGFGGAPKFPRPSVLDLLAHLDARKREPVRRQAIGRTLEMMWRGGLYDHVGGGFARYSTDERWLVPHFEKMLYDNAQLIDAYLDGAALLARPDFLEIAGDVARYVEREMTAPDGGFHAAQDADSEGEEGRFYLFSPDDLRQALGPDAERAARVFGVTDAGNFEGGNVLHWPRSVEETAAAEGMSRQELERFVAAARCKLHGFRETRTRPARDDKVLASWNGLMIHALARLGATLGRRETVDVAARAAEFVERRLRQPDGGLLRRSCGGEARYEGSLDDHADCAFGFLGLFEATGEPEFLRRALDLVRVARERFEDPAGGFWFAAASPDLIVRMKEATDGALPSGNSMMALLAARLSAITHDEDLREMGRRCVRSFSEELAAAPHGYPLLLAAWIELREPPRTITIAAHDDDPLFRAEVARAHRAVLPGRVVIPVLDRHRAALEAVGAALPKDVAPRARPASLLCEDLTCRPF